MNLTRRALAGVAAAAATVARAPFNQFENQEMRTVPSAGMQMAQAPQEDPNYRVRLRSSLLEQRARTERWARGEFEAHELRDVNHDPRSRAYDATGHAINSLRSVSQAHKVRMAEALSQQRFRQYRIDMAKERLVEIAKELLGLA